MKFILSQLLIYIFFLSCNSSVFSQINTNCNNECLSIEETQRIADSILIEKKYKVSKKACRNDIKFDSERQYFVHWHCYLKDSTKYEKQYICLIIDPCHGELIKEGGIHELYHNMDNFTPDINKLELLDTSKLMKN